ncbi:hypothetical protein [Sporomusa aerivorans]|uniref:hypothetical protein n=1 Tax=Sporomusa aerivorans TaxID=204936 RepID=UPI003529DF05
MPKRSKSKETLAPVVKITLLNYDVSLQDTYSNKFMIPLIEGILKRTQLAQAK